MKNKFFLLFALLGSARVLMAQDNNVQYKVTRDDPNDICNLYVFLDPFQMDAPLKNILGLSFNTGISSMGLVKDRFGFDAQFRFGTLTMYRLANSNAGRALQIEAGGMFKLRDHTRTKSKTKVVLDITQSTNANGDRIETTKFIRIPAQQRVLLHARGGIYLKKNPFVTEIDDYGTELEGNLTSIGFYVGISRMSVHNIYINTNTDGKASRSGIMRFYADVIICPVRSLSSFADGEPIEDVGKHLSSPVGFRIGIWGMPCEDRANKKRKAFMVGAEMGIRPGDGIYCTGSFMFPLVRKKSVALGYKRPEGTNEKGQVIEKE